MDIHSELAHRLGGNDNRPIPDDAEAFRARPWASFLVRPWHRADASRIDGSPGSDREPGWVVVAFPSGELVHRWFPHGFNETHTARRARILKWALAVASFHKAPGTLQ